MESVLDAVSSSYDMDKNLKRICYIGNIASQSNIRCNFTGEKHVETVVIDINNNALSKGAVV
jgi:hypothetical protein